MPMGVGRERVVLILVVHRPGFDPQELWRRLLEFKAAEPSGTQPESAELGDNR